jgi:hypothetical protein
MAIKSNINIDQGTTFSLVVEAVHDNNSPIDLTNHTANSQIRKHYSSTNSVSFTTNVNSSLSTVTLSLTSTQTANIEWGRYVYDVNITSNSGIVTRIVEGIATVSPRVTR